MGAPLIQKASHASSILAWDSCWQRGRTLSWHHPGTNNWVVVFCRVSACGYLSQKVDCRWQTHMPEFRDSRCQRCCHSLFHLHELTSQEAGSRECRTLYVDDLKGRGRSNQSLLALWSRDNSRDSPAWHLCEWYSWSVCTWGPDIPEGCTKQIFTLSSGSLAML